MQDSNPNSNLDPKSTCLDCGKTFTFGDWPFQCGGRGHLIGPFFTAPPNIHSSEQVTLMVNPKTGETRIPGRADRPINPKYAAAGFEYRRLETIQEVRAYEKTKGVIHEKSHYDNSGRAERDTGEQQ